MPFARPSLRSKSSYSSSSISSSASPSPSPSVTVPPGLASEAASAPADLQYQQQHREPDRDSADQSSSAPSPSLATPWSSESTQRQLEEMRAEAASAASRDRPARSSPESQKHKAIMDGGPALTRLSSRSNGASLASPPLERSSRMSIKQRLFQISDNEEQPGATTKMQGGNVVNDNNSNDYGRDNDDDDDDESSHLRDHMEALIRLRAARSDPMRRSISALSGVTVIGKGHNRDREGSTSTVGSVSSRRTNSSMDGQPVPAQGDEAPPPSSAILSGRNSDSVKGTPLPNSDSVALRSGTLQNDSDDQAAFVTAPLPLSADKSMDLSAALDLLEKYPRSSHSPAVVSGNRSASISKPSDASSTTGAPAGVNAHPAEALYRANAVRPALAAPASHETGHLASSALSATSPHRPGMTVHPVASTSQSAISRPRKHSRSSISERDRLFGPLSPITPTAQITYDGEGPRLQRSLSPAVSIHSAMADGDSAEHRKSPVRSRPPSFSGFSFEDRSPSLPQQQEFAPEQQQLPSRRPVLSRRSSRNSEKAPENDGERGSELSRSVSSSSRNISSHDLHHIMRSFSSRPRRSTSRTSIANTDSTGTTSIEGLQRSSRTPTATADLKHLIQQKRRMASAPFKTQASLGDSVPPSGANSPVLSLRSGQQSPEMLPEDPSGEGNIIARRQRSRRNTANVPAGLSSLTTAASESTAAIPFEQARLRAMRGMGEVVMTPSIEEWRQLGLHESLNESDSGSESDSDSDAHPDSGQGTIPEGMLGVDLTPRPRLGSIQAVNQFYGAVPPREYLLGGMSRSHTSPELSRTASLKGKRILEQEGDTSFDSDSRGGHGKRSDTEEELEDDEDGSGVLAKRRAGNALPTLSRQSLSAPTGSPGPAGRAAPSPAEVTAAIRSELHPNASRGPKSQDYTRTVSSIDSSTANSMSPSPLQYQAGSLSSNRPLSPLPLTQPGPIDPRRYSAVTGARDIDSFAVVSEAGRGAYGLVRKVREISEDGYPVGPDLMLKYIVKQRILADAYKRHKVLGAIPMEIHVLDYIRRVYKPVECAAGEDPVKAAANFRLVNAGAPAIPDHSDQVTIGHPNLCGMLDFFEDAENYYLVMACFGNGQDLFDYVDMAPTGLSIEEARSILSQIVDALAFLHAHGIVHRDIKDENIILDGKGRVQLIDFGSAAYIKEGKPYFDTFSGTLDFASPEVLRGERYGGKETDVWALGVLAYVILCGECPFWSSEESLMGLAPHTRAEDALQAKAEHTLGDLVGPERDAAASLANAAIDFVHQCLQTHSRDRPTAVQLKQHRFIVSASPKSDTAGWSGLRGWEQAVEDGNGE